MTILLIDYQLWIFIFYFPTVHFLGAPQLLFVGQIFEYERVVSLAVNLEHLAVYLEVLRRPTGGELFMRD